MTGVPGATNDPEIIERAVAGCEGGPVVLVPWGVHGYSTGSAEAVLDHEMGEARLFLGGWGRKRAWQGGGGGVADGTAGVFGRVGWVRWLGCRARPGGGGRPGVVWDRWGAVGGGR